MHLAKRVAEVSLDRTRMPFRRPHIVDGLDYDFDEAIMIAHRAKIASQDDGRCVLMTAINDFNLVGYFAEKT
jgi:hypothetical protein